MKEIDYAQYRTDTFRYYSQQFAPIRAMKAEDAGSASTRPHGPAAGSLLSGFPNLMLNIYPDNISTNLIVPLSHEKTLTIFVMVFPRCRLGEKSERINRSVAFQR